jgi:hypothetical protein
MRLCFPSTSLAPVSNRAGRRYEQQLEPNVRQRRSTVDGTRSESGTRTPITRFAGAALTQNDRLAMRTTIAGMGVPVKNLELTTTDDGRQRLRIELGDEAGTVMTWYGHLEIEPQEPRSDRPLAWDLILTARPGVFGEEWGRLQVEPPHGLADSSLLIGR